MSNGSKKKLDWQKNIKGKNKGVEIENILMLLSCLQAGAQEAMFFRKKHGLFLFARHGRALTGESPECT
jgi:hypothetical protein